MHRARKKKLVNNLFFCSSILKTWNGYLFINWRTWSESSLSDFNSFKIHWEERWVCSSSYVNDVIYVSDSHRWEASDRFVRNKFGRVTTQPRVYCRKVFPHPPGFAREWKIKRLHSRPCVTSEKIGRQKHAALSVFCLQDVSIGISTRDDQSRALHAFGVVRVSCCGDI